MKKNVLLLLVTMLLSGCATVYKTPPLKADLSRKINLNLKLDDFEYSRRQNVRLYNSASSGTYTGTYNDTILDGHINSSTTRSTYYQKKDIVFDNHLVDTFEKLGVNIKTGYPDLILVGRIGNGWRPYDEASVYYKDIPLFVSCILTLGSTFSATRENTVSIIVYTTAGKRIKEYHSRQLYNAVSIGFLLGGIVNSDTSRWIGGRRAACSALNDCVNQFTNDYHSGYYRNYIKKVDEETEN